MIERERDKRQSAATPREKTRAEEEQRYPSVIVKRTDEARRHPDDILQYASEEGLEQLQRPVVSLLLSAIVAGITLGFTAMSAAVVTTICHEAGWEHLTRLATALV